MVNKAEAFENGLTLGVMVGDGYFSIDYPSWTFISVTCSTSKEVKQIPSFISFCRHLTGTVVRIIHGIGRLSSALTLPIYGGTLLTRLITVQSSLKNLKIFINQRLGKISTVIV